MEELSKEYVLLFNGVTEMIGEMESMIQRMKLLQQAAENHYLDNGESMRAHSFSEEIAFEQAST